MMLSARVLIAVPALAQRFAVPKVDEGARPGRRVPAACPPRCRRGGSGRIAACAAQGLKVTALIDRFRRRAGRLISGDGAASITQRIASGKAETALKMKMTSGAADRRAKTDQAFMAQLMADPAMGRHARAGCLYWWVVRVIGAIAVSGAPVGAIDEPCARAGLAKIQDRSMSKFRAACVQLRSGEDVAENIRDASRLIREAAEGGAQFIATPENTTLMAPDGGAKLANPSTKRMIRRCRFSPRWPRSWASGF